MIKIYFIYLLYWYFYGLSYSSFKILWWRSSWRTSCNLQCCVCVCVCLCVCVCVGAPVWLCRYADGPAPSMTCSQSVNQTNQVLPYSSHSNQSLWPVPVVEWLNSEPHCAQVLGLDQQHLEQMLREVAMIAQSKISSPLVQAILRVSSRSTARVRRAIRVNWSIA